MDSNYLKSRFNIQVLRNIEDLEHIKQEWLQIENHPNAAYDLFKIVHDVRPEVLRPHVIVVYRDGRIEGLLLGRIEEGPVDFRLGYLTLFRLQMRSLIMLHEGVLGNMDEEVTLIALRPFFEELKAGKVNRILISNWREDSPVLRAAWSLSTRVNQSYPLIKNIHHSMDLPPKPGDFMARMRSKHRSWIKRKVKELDARFPGSVKYISIRNCSELKKGIEDIEQVASKTYQRGLEVGFKNDTEHFRRFQAEAVAGRLRIAILYGGGEPLAFWIGFVFGGTFYSSFTGYDPGMRENELGTLIMIYLIDELCAEKVEVFDFGLGDADYKKRYSNNSWTEVSFSIYRNSLRGLLLNAFFSTNQILEGVLRKGLEAFGLTNKLKRLLRNKAATRNELR